MMNSLIECWSQYSFRISAGTRPWNMFCGSRIAHIFAFLNIPTMRLNACVHVLVVTIDEHRVFTIMPCVSTTVALRPTKWCPSAKGWRMWIHNFINPILSPAFIQQVNEPSRAAASLFHQHNVTTLRCTRTFLCSASVLLPRRIIWFCLSFFVFPCSLSLLLFHYRTSQANYFEFSQPRFTFHKSFNPASNWMIRRLVSLLFISSPANRRDPSSPAQSQERGHWQRAVSC